MCVLTRHISYILCVFPTLRSFVCRILLTTLLSRSCLGSFPHSEFSFCFSYNWQQAGMTPRHSGFCLSGEERVNRPASRGAARILQRSEGSTASTTVGERSEGIGREGSGPFLFFLRSL